ncbi:hypothetical protein Tco_0123099 [Tanacetum coccineum]
MNSVMTRELDDLIMFPRGDIQSAKILIEALEEFKCASEGSLPIKYLRVPLISSRLVHRDCKIVVERVQKWIGDWKNKWLSFAGRLQLCLSVVSSMHVYWASVFILPIGILNEGGLGIRKLDRFNIALMSSHIWKILMNMESLWARWIHSYKLKHRSFLDVKIASNVSKGWRKLLQICNIIRPHIWFIIGDRREASMWFDTWDSNCPLVHHLSYQAIHNASFSILDKVADLILDNAWSWPAD